MPTPTRAQLTDRRLETFDALLDAARTVVDETGFEALTVRNVAAAAGVTHTTAYSFVTSKAQLIAELYVREIERLAPVVPDPSAAAADRIDAALRGPATLFADQPAVAHAAQISLLIDDSDDAVPPLRARIGAITFGRLRAALPAADDDTLGVIFAAYNGAMIVAGTGNGSYDDVVVTVRRLVDLLGLD